MKKIICVILCSLLSASCVTVLAAAESLDSEQDAKSLILIEASSGKVLYERDPDEVLPPASVTKIMTLLLTFEALDSGKISWDDSVTVSEEAASMGGSQVYLAPGETMSVTDLVKSVAVASANDAAAALAEHVSGSIDGFVKLMNERAAQLGMCNTVFYNATGLDDAECNLTTARDISLMSAELLKHEKIFEFTTIWMDSIRNGEFGLTNTNRLIRFYKGANGLKTGSTSKAGFCISATAKRDGMQLIAVIMGSPNRDTRNAVAKKLLDYGFAEYARFYEEAHPEGSVKVLGGVKSECGLIRSEFNLVTEKSTVSNLKTVVVLPEYINAPIKAGDVLGSAEYYNGEEKIGSADILASEDIERIGFFEIFTRLLKRFII